ncbi:MAG: NuoM family protein [Phycisphaerales bacterium]
MTLLALIMIPILAGLLVAFMPKENAKQIAVLGTVLPIAWFLYVLRLYSWPAGSTDQLDMAIEWFPALGLKLELAADNISMLLVALTLLLGPICVICSFTAITERIKTYYSWLLILQGAMTGVFLARDVILFYVFFEFTLVPLYVLINLYGSTNRKAAATKFFLYTFTGSVLTLAGLIYVAWFNAAHVSVDHAWTFSFAELRSAAHEMPFSHQAWVFWALMAGFAIKVPLFPVHTWLPLAHTEAPTAGSVILAGVLLKLGTYGIYRFALGFTPDAAIFYAPTVAVLSIIGILYGGLICWVQTDVKKLVAYSSVSHLGFCVLGLFAFNTIGLSGAVLYMINHGLSTGALFLMIGMVYERYHTRDMSRLSGLAATMPIWATFMVFFTMASVGLPGLNGFVSEFMCLLGAFQAGGEWVGRHTVAGGAGGNLGPWFAFAAGIGMIVTAIYLLFMLGKVVWGAPADHHGGHGGDDAHAADHGPLPRDLSWREIGVLLPLAALCLLLGLYPKPLLKALEGPTQDMRRVHDQAMDRLSPPADEAPSEPAPGHAAADTEPDSHPSATVATAPAAEDSQ